MPPAAISGGRMRFSSTDRLEKMPRSSGQYPTPRCAILYVGAAMVSTPFTAIDPVRLPTRPRIALRVVVRPAPLRPRSVTTSPLFTLNATPCSTCDSPYHAWRSETRRTSSAIRAPHVRLDHLGIRRDLGVAPFGQHRASRQH